MSELEPSEFPSPSSGKKVDREGLPSSYRMRADAHYVDQLAGRRAPDAEAPRAPTRVSDADTHAEPRERLEKERDRTEREKDTRERRADRVIAQLLQEVEAISASAALVSGTGAALAQRANIAAVRAHAHRAGWLMRAHTIVENGYRAQVRSRPLGRLLEQVREGLAAECGLTGLHLDVQAGDWNALVPMDDGAMAAGLTAAIFASVALLPDPAGATIKITASTLGAELRSLEVSQDESAIPATTSPVFFDQGWAERPGGPWAATAAACVKAVAAMHGGDAVFMPGARRGSTIRFNFNRTAN